MTPDAIRTVIAEAARSIINGARCSVDLTCPSESIIVERITRALARHDAELVERTRREALEEAALCASTTSVKAMGEGAIRIRIAEAIRSLKER